MRKPAVLLISYHFYPSNEIGAKRPSETAHYLARHGYEVTIVRAVERTKSTDRKWPGFRCLNVVSVTIPRKILTACWMMLKSTVRTVAPAKESTDMPDSHSIERPEGKIRKTIRWLRRQLLAIDTLFQGNKLWMAKAIFRITLLRCRRRIDVVIASGPPLVGYVCGLAASKICGAALILDFRDPWFLHGDNVRKTQMFGHPLATWENSFAQRCISRSSLITVASPGIRRHIEETFDASSKPIKLVRNGFDDIAVIDEPPPIGRLDILYAGSLYWHRNPFPFLEALGGIACLPDINRELIRFTLVGDCEEWEGVALRPWVDKHGLQDIVRIMRPVKADELRDLIVASNVLINFAQGQPRQIPAKSYEYLAARRDLLIVTEEDGDVADLFREAGIGEIVNSDDAAALGTVILALYEKYVNQCQRAGTESLNIAPFSRSAQLEIFELHVQQVLAS